MNRRSRYPTRSCRKKTGPRDAIFITMVIARVNRANIGKAARQHTTSTARFQAGMGTGRLMDGMMLIIWFTGFSDLGPCGRQTGMLQTKRTRVCARLTTGLPRRRQFSRVQRALDGRRAIWGVTLCGTKTLRYSATILSSRYRGMPESLENACRGGPPSAGFKAQNLAPLL